VALGISPVLTAYDRLDPGPGFTWDVLEGRPFLYFSEMTDDGLSPGDLLAGRFRLIDRIGSGGMAVIWRAHDETLERLVAVKVLHLELSGDSRMRELVRREAWAAARLNHPDVASVHDFVLVDGDLGILVMQLVEGEPLADLIARGPVPWRETVRIGLRVARVLELAHGRGVIHRDITPDNIIIDGDRVTVLDFGIAARIGEPDDDSTGASFGTPAYVAPERLDGTPAQTATDIYALGVVLYEMLTGRMPYKVSGWDDVATDHGPAPAPRVSKAPHSLTALVSRMLSRDPSRRPNAAEVVATLQAPSRVRPLGAALVTALAGVVAALLLWSPWNSGTTTSPQPSVAEPKPSTVSPSSAPTPTPRQLDVEQARGILLALLSKGERDGNIRKDVAEDLRNVVAVSRTRQDWSNVSSKITARQREKGALTPDFAILLHNVVNNVMAINSMTLNGA
jgi:serine/threonine-protein kinase